MDRASSADSGGNRSRRSLFMSQSDHPASLRATSPGVVSAGVRAERSDSARVTTLPPLRRRASRRAGQGRRDPLSEVRPRAAGRSVRDRSHGFFRSSSRASRIDEAAARVVGRLTRSGFEAYLVGGCVRDLLVDKRPKDFDVATSARPEEVRSLFRNSRIIGRRFRLVHVLFPAGHVRRDGDVPQEPDAGRAARR